MKLLSLITILMMTSLSQAGLKGSKPEGAKEEGKGKVEAIKPNANLSKALSAKGLADVSTFWADAGIGTTSKDQKSIAELINALDKAETVTLEAKKPVIAQLAELHTTVGNALTVGKSISESGKILVETAKNLAINGIKMAANDKNSSVNTELLAKVADLLKLDQNQLKDEATCSARILEVEALLNGKKIKDIIECF